MWEMDYPIKVSEHRDNPELLLGTAQLSRTSHLNGLLPTDIMASMVGPFLEHQGYLNAGYSVFSPDQYSQGTTKVLLNGEL